MKPRMLVRHKENKRMGVVVDSAFGAYFPGEVAVLWEGYLDNTANGFHNPSELEVTGQETPVADLEKCGCGGGEKTCVFLTLAPRPTCQRFLRLHDELVERAKMGKSGARRIPTEFFPKCQL